MSDTEEGEDLGAIAWPGFVDILSSVIIMFVFFVMVVASALYFHIIIFKSKILSEVSESISAQSEAKELAQTNRALTQQIEEMTEKMKILEDINAGNKVQMYKEDSEFAESTEQKIIEDKESRSIVVFFGTDSISVTQDNQDMIRNLIDSYAGTNPENVKISIVSGKNVGAVNDIVARRLAVARMLNVRNMFLETDIPAGQIVPSISDKEQIEGSYNWVRITFSEQ